MAEETQKIKRGRPKITDKETKSKNFTLKIKPSTFRELNRICGLRQLETGIRASVTDLINNVLEDYVEKNGIKD
mgnify:CR=1 FL=1